MASQRYTNAHIHAIAAHQPSLCLLIKVFANNHHTTPQSNAIHPKSMPPGPIRFTFEYDCYPRLYRGITLCRNVSKHK